MRKLTFRQRVLLLAVTLATAIQLATAIAVLSAIDAGPSAAGAVGADANHLAASPRDDEPYVAAAPDRGNSIYRPALGRADRLAPARGRPDTAAYVPGSPRSAERAYRRIRNILLTTTSLSVLLAAIGALWLADTVKRPVEQLVAGARRMREGMYNEPVNVATADELGELAASFNAMQLAIADRERHIFHQAHHDSLSGLPSRELVISRLREVLGVTATLSVVNLELDRFSGIVASLGHRTGEEVIKLVASLLRNRMDEGHVLGHLGPQDFVLALPGADSEQAAEWVEQFAADLKAGVRVGGAKLSLQATAGIACHPEHGKDAAELCRRASIARDEALRRHQPLAVYRGGHEDRSQRQIKIVADFPQAIERNELRLSLQPKIDCRTQAVVGAEALVRWQHPELGLLMPGAFVEAIEQAGSIAQLTRWILREAVAECGAWRRRGIELSVAANISVDDLIDEYLPYFLLELVKEHGLKPADVTLEVTESGIMRNVYKSLAVVSCVHELGFRIAIDDFATGQSSLGQLKRLPLDEIKVDKSFVMNIHDSRDLAIVRTTIDLAHQLGIAVVAEGVEHHDALATLQALGCEYAQGYYICDPLPHEEFLPWLARWQTERQGLVTVAPKAKSASRAGTVS